MLGEEEGAGRSKQEQRDHKKRQRGRRKDEHEAVCASGAPCVLFIAFEAPVDAVAHSTQ